MKKWKNALMWLVLLTKRLYKKPAFLAILLLIPLLTFGYEAMTGGDSGMVTIALAKEADDPITEAVFRDLQGSGQLFRYVVCDSPAHAQLLVQTGKADGAWIFPADVAGHMEEFMSDPDIDNAFIRVLEREENVLQMLTRERLSGAVYHYLSQYYYLDYMRQEYPQLSDLSDKALMEYYEQVEMTDNLFAYDTVAGRNIQQVHYLMSPVRGLLAIVVMLCGLAAAMYYIKDCQNGTFAWVPARRMVIPELGCQIAAVFHVALVATVALMLVGIGEDLLLELLIMVLYTLCVVAFCMLLRALLRSVRVLGALLPLLIVLMLLLCPVFFDLAKLRLLQFLLPPTYFINAAYNPMYILYMVIHTLVCGGLYLLLTRPATRH